MSYNSRRAPVYSTKGIVASSQPLASMAGIKILQQGGNAADAAVATAAALNITEPCSTGLGGDCFCLFYDASSKKIHGVNGSGRAPAGLTVEKLHEQGINDKMPARSIHTITVPGAAAGWVDTIERHGSLTMKEILQPAIELANGYPVSPGTSSAWQRSASLISKGPYGEEIVINGRGPGVGEIMRNPTLSDTFKSIAEHGKDGYYKGRIAEAIVDLIAPMGSYMTVDDLKKHRSTFPEPISTNYHGVDVYEVPPNGQGITALLALNIAEEYDFTSMGHNSVEHLHKMIEAMRLAFADTRWYVADSDLVDIPIKELISKQYASERRKLINPKRATIDQVKGSPYASSDTVYFCTADGDGNACSFINSNYAGFGTGLVPQGCGFTLQNRGANFSVDPGHPNCVAPNKRPYHTIIPGMMMKDGELYAPFGVMGGFNQPQGHMQVVINMVDFGMNPQEALDAPRFSIGSGTAGGAVNLEEGISMEVMSTLSRMGHVVNPRTGSSRGAFGKGQIITRNPKTGVLCGGSSPRADGMAIPLF